MKKNKGGIIAIIIVIILIASFLILNKLNIQNNQGGLFKISYTTLQEKIDKKETFALIISRSNCSHCISYKPKVEQIAKKNNIKVYYIDYDEEEEKEINSFFEKYNLDGSTPITIFIKDGQETSILNRLEGDVDREQIIERFKKMDLI